MFLPHAIAACLAVLASLFGLLITIGIDTWEPITYAYDDQRRVIEMDHYGPVLESYTYDDLGRVTHSYRAGEDDWTYTNGRFSETTQRTSLTGTVEDFLYDEWSRMTKWSTTPPGGSITRRFLRYDGLGRLDQLKTTTQGLPNDYVDYGYDYDNNMVIEARQQAMVVNNILRFEGIRYESETAELIESTLPMAKLEDGDLRWLMHDVDGHALAVYDHFSGQELTFDVSGVYGHDLDLAVSAQAINYDYFKGDIWKLDGLHSGERDHDRGLVHRGKRHALLDDGRWLQPEPLLGAGINNAELSNPNALFGVYAGGNPLMYEDNTGYWLESAWDAASLAVGAVSLAQNVKDGNYGAAALDAVGVVADAAALALPAVPGGAGAAIKAARGGANVVDAAMDVKSGAKVAEAAGDAGGAKNLVQSPGTAGSPCKLNCFVAGTLVIVVDGDAAIEQVEVGDAVIAYDPAAVGEWIPLKPDPSPDPSSCDPEVDPDCKREQVPVEVAPASEEVRHD